MHQLEILDLSFNLITTLQKLAFWGLTRLRILRLTHNNISKLNTDDFKWVPVLEVLDLDQNSIASIEDGVFKKQREPQELRLGKLDIIYILKINMIFYANEIPPKLRYLNIDASYGTNFEISPKTIAPNGTLIFHLNGDYLEVNLCDNAFFKAVRELEVSTSHFSCRTEFMARCFPNLESFEFLTRIDKVTVTYSGINTLRHLKRLKLTNLNFAKQTDAGTIFHNLTKLQILVLNNCRFTFLTRSMFQNLTTLRILCLYSASPLLLLDGVFDVLNSLTTVVFDKVDFRCDCENSWLLRWAERSVHAQVIYLQRQECMWHYKKRNFLSTMERLCQTDMEYQCYLATALTISFLMATALGYNFGRWPFLVLFFRARGRLERRIGQRRRRGRRMDERAGEEEEEEDVQFDAFVSFSSRDEAWVLRDLAPRLEEQGEPRLKLCLHNRDFEVGKGIVDNIAESIYSSRRTVCVLSRRYLRSDWCALELRVATHRLLAEQKHRLIIIFLEHISPFELSAFHRLAKLVKSRTYLDWPEDDAERVNFWERLRRNIAEEDRVSVWKICVCVCVFGGVGRGSGGLGREHWLHLNLPPPMQPCNELFLLPGKPGP
ncbi:LOW QUALITY PROTEIN: toll-like receptor 13 [Alosa sapidissima]|uniref:LOW QUALITY PROTEIN: toll-like receptor 13 n=1 Tax=Alosa sapidissima TaxID=34773 RepID=UPI001C09A4B8|nr:LOW QUALITY PROTEIN: toll-like receptor 13 [Alosa sapidissima]